MSPMNLLKIKLEVRLFYGCKKLSQFKKCKLLGMKEMAHSYNPSYSGDSDWENHGKNLAGLYFTKQVRPIGGAWL